MKFREIAAPDGLEHVVACFWEFVVGESVPAGHIHTIPPDGCTSIAIVPGMPVVFVGPRLDAHKVSVQPGMRYFGVRFRPGATRAVIGVSGQELRDKVGPLAFVVPDFTLEYSKATVNARSLEESVAALIPVLQRSKNPDPLVQAATVAIEVSVGTAKIDQIATLMSKSERQVQRRFKEEVGLTPKQYSRICRFRAAAIDVASPELRGIGTVAAERGYADQPHLVREFTELFGMTPIQFRKQFAASIDHSEIVR